MSFSVFFKLCSAPYSPPGTVRRLTSSFFSSTDRTPFVSLRTGVSLLNTDKSPRLSDGIRREAPSGTTRLGEEAEGGIPRVRPTGKARLAGVGCGVEAIAAGARLGVCGGCVEVASADIPDGGGVDLRQAVDVELVAGPGGARTGEAGRGGASEESEERCDCVRE